MSTIQLDTELLNSIVHLPPEQLGEAFAAVIEYANTQQIKVLSDPTANLAYSVMVDMTNKFWKRQEEIKNSRANGGKKGGRPPKTLRLSENHKVSENENSSTHNNKIFIKEEKINKGNIIQDIIQEDNISTGVDNYPPSNIPVRDKDNINIIPPKKNNILTDIVLQNPPLPTESSASQAIVLKKTSKESLSFDWAQLIAYFNSAMASQAIKPIARITDVRKRNIMARAREFGKEAIVQVIDKAAASDFLNGRIGDGAWIADFDWLFKPTKFPRILEGYYDNDKNLSHGNKNRPFSYEQQRELERQERLQSYAEAIAQVGQEATGYPDTLSYGFSPDDGVLPDSFGSDNKPF